MGGIIPASYQHCPRGGEFAWSVYAGGWAGNEIRGGMLQCKT